VVLRVEFCGCEETEEAYAGLLLRQPSEAVHASRLKVLATSSVQQYRYQYAPPCLTICAEAVLTI
jgi:hypothetical protein